MKWNENETQMQMKCGIAMFLETKWKLFALIN